MMKTAVYLRGLLSSWGGQLANIGVMFFLSPWVVHSLGDEKYGLWSLLMTVSGYLGLAEVGVRVSTGRYINYYLGRGQPGRVSQVVNTSIAFYCLVSLLIAGAAVVMGQCFSWIFPRIATADAAQVQPILLLMALNVWLGLAGATFGQLLYANDRLDLLNLIAVLVLCVRAGGTVAVLSCGGGLPGLAMAMVVSSGVGMLLSAAGARRKGVRVRYGLSLASMQCFRELIGFGFWSCLTALAARFRGYAGAAIVGILLGAKEVAYYSIGYMLIDSAKDLLSHVLRVLAPDIQKSAGANGDMGRTMVQATRATMFMAVPMLVGLLTLGGEFIRQWMGVGYEQAAGVLLLVTISQFANVAGMSCGTVLHAMGHVRLLAGLAVMEAMLNLAFSVAMVEFFHLGIYGVALGLAVPSLAVSGAVQVAVACRRTKIRIGSYLRATLIRWGAAAALLLPAALLISHLVGPGGWGHLSLKAGLVLAVYAPLGFALVLGRQRSRELLSWLRPGLQSNVPASLEGCSGQLASTLAKER